MTDPQMAIPHITLGTEDGLLHFAHANGYPPEAYTPFLEHFALEYQVVASYFRPLWPNTDPEELSDWSLLGQDLLRFLVSVGAKASPGENKIIGIGHSVGATSTLMASLERPELFQALVLVEPILFVPWKRAAWRVITKLGVGPRLHPLIKGALNRRSRFPSREAMYENYRTKAVFRRISNQGLRAYVNALSRQEPDGQVRLAYSPQWEARIYATAGLHDVHLWRRAPQLNIPVLLIQGANSNSFRDHTARRLLNRLPCAELHTIPQTGHLAPLEAPERVFQVMNTFLSSKVRI